MTLRATVPVVIALAACSAAADPAPVKSLLPGGATVISSARVELDGRAPEETVITYHYKSDGELVEGIAIHKPSCGLVWSSEDALGATVAPSWEATDLTGDGVKEFVASQSVHAGQESWVHIYKIERCEAVELLNEFVRPPEPLSLHRDPSGPLVTFTFRGYDSCLPGGGEEEGYVKSYRPTASGFTLLESKPYQKLYPFFPPNRSGGSEAVRIASWFVGRAEIYDHLSADLNGDGEKELAFLYDAGKGGGLLVLSFDKTKRLWGVMLQASFGMGPLPLEGYVRAISSADLTGDGGSELIIDASAELGCKLETFVLRFTASGPELLLDVRRPYKDPLSFGKRSFSYREAARGALTRWSWDGAAFSNGAGETSAPRLLSTQPASEPASEPVP